MWQFRVTLKTNITPWKVYQGYIEVKATDETEALELALKQIDEKFPDKNRAFWDHVQTEKVLC